jgi:hypothetical protein
LLTTAGLDFILNFFYIIKGKVIPVKAVEALTVARG